MTAPIGYPYILWCNENADPQFFLARDLASAMLIAKQKNYKGVISKVQVNTLTRWAGHNSTHRFLKRIGPHWVCREGAIYYKGTPTVVTTHKSTLVKNR